MLLLITCFLLGAACKDSTQTSLNLSENPEKADSLLNLINLPDGFEISIYAEVDNARSLAISPSGTI